MASRAVTPPSSPRRWSGSRARTSRRYASRPAPTRSPPSSRRPTTSWPRPTPTVTCPLRLLLRRRELRRIPLLRGWVNRGKLSLCKRFEERCLESSLCQSDEFSYHTSHLVRHFERRELAHPFQAVHRVPRMLPSECLLYRKELGRPGLGVHVEHGHLWAEVAQHPKRLALERIHSKNLSSSP